MNIYFITPFPESIKILIENNISNQGIKKELIDVNIINLRDFSDNELNIMKNNNVINYNLGQRRLRSETAALYSISFLNEVLR